MKTGSDTPDVDGERIRLIGGNETPHAPIPANFARKLERERDALHNLLTVALQHGLTDQVRAEGEELLKLRNEH